MFFLRFCHSFRLFCVPRYVPREWILVEAYEKAAEGDYSLVKELLELFRRPYDEQPPLVLSLSLVFNRFLIDFHCFLRLFDGFQVGLS